MDRAWAGAGAWAGVWGGWSQRTTITVTEYELHACNAGDALSIAIRNPQLTVRDGLPVDSRKARRAANATAAMIKNLAPIYRVRGDGALVGVAPAIAETTTPELQQLRKQMKDPTRRAIFENDAIDLWMAWVGAWRNVSLKRPMPRTLAVANPTWPRSKPPTRPMTVEVHQRDDGKLRLVGKLREHGLHVALHVPPAELNSIGKKRLMSAKVARTVTWRVITDPRTLRPFTAHSASHTHISLADGTSHQFAGQAMFEFDWKAGTSRTALCP